jgi:type III pantothenate kinase
MAAVNARIAAERAALTPPATLPVSIDHRRFSIDDLGMRRFETVNRGTFMFLAIDIGNTNITLGLYRGEKPGPRWRLATGHEKTPDEYGALMTALLRHTGFSVSAVTAIAMACVVPPLTGVFVEACRRYYGCEPLVVEGTGFTGLKILYDDPSQVGADRIVDAAAAYWLYGGPDCIIDFGTATTFDAVSAEGDYLGGAIMPGIGIASEALFERASKLPKVDLLRPPSPIGRNVVHSLQSGLLFGYVGVVEGMVDRFRAELGPETKVIATGGLAEIVSRETKAISVLAPWLTLDGLRMIYELNDRR